VQRRNQKVVERAPAPYLEESRRAELCGAALKLARAAKYTHAGTVEFLMDADTNAFYFIEVNPRIQVEHTVTEEVTGVDIVKAQIRISEGACVGDADSYVPWQSEIRLNGHAVQCRITTEDPENGFTPDYGRINVYRSPAGFGIRLDGGTAYSGAVITPYYDSLLVKVTAWGHSADEAAASLAKVYGAMKPAEAAPIATAVAAKAAELAAVAGEKAGPVAHRAADVTEDVGAQIARRSRKFAEDLRQRGQGAELLLQQGDALVRFHRPMPATVVRDLQRLPGVLDASAEDLARVPGIDRALAERIHAGLQGN